MSSSLPLELLVEIASRSENLELISTIPDHYAIASALFPIHPREVVQFLISRQLLDTLKRLEQEYEFDYQIDDMVVALRSAPGNIEMVEHLRSKSIALPYQAMDYAAETGNIALIEHLSRLGYVASERTIAAAAEYGHLDLIKYLEQNGVEPTEDALIKAATSGRHDIIDQLRVSNVPVEAIRQAVIGGNIQVLQRLLPYVNEPVSTDVISLAYALDRTEMLKLLDPRGMFKPSEETLKAAIDYGNLPVVKRLYRKFKFSFFPLDTAIKNGHMDVVKYVHSRRLYINGNELMIACSSGRLEMVRWIVSVSQFTASELGSCLLSSASEGNLSIVQLLLEYVHVDPNAIAAAAAKSGNLHLVRYIIQRYNVELAHVIVSAAEFGHLSLIKALPACNVVFSTQSVMTVIERGYLNTLKYMIEQGVEGVPVESTDLAVRNNHLAVAQYLLGLGIEQRYHQPSTSLELIELQYRKFGMPLSIDKLLTENNISAVVFYLKQGYRFSLNDFIIAVDRNELSIVKLITTQIKPTAAMISYARDHKHNI